MKIGILTFHFALNYGAVLQTFALSRYLKELGHDVFIIDRIPASKTIFHEIYSFLHGPLKLFYWKKFREFSKAYLQPKTRRYASFSSLSSFQDENFDFVIVGSDQVWRFKMIGFNYFLDFVNGNRTKKISYAASFGKAHWNESTNYTETIKKMLNDFTAISVRENSGVTICKNIFGVDAACVLDPTLLVTGDFYENQLLNNYPKKSNEKIVSYFLGSNPKRDLVPCANLAKLMGLLYEDLWFIESQNYSLLNIHKMHNYTHVRVEYWLNEIRNAKYIITNSFHATVFAILFRKQFVVIDLPGGGTSRIEHLTKILNLEDRFISSIDDLSIDLLNKSIDYNAVETNLNIYRKESHDFLVKSLNTKN